MKKKPHLKEDIKPLKTGGETVYRKSNVSHKKQSGKQMVNPNVKGKSEGVS